MSPKKIYYIFFSLLILFPHALMGQTAGDLVGIWLTTDGKSKVQITMNKEERSFTGEIIWLKDALKEGKPLKDDNGNFVLGMKILQDFTFDSDEWTGGTIYDPESLNTYYGTISLAGAKKLKLRGSVDPMGWIGRTETWHRVIE